MKRRRDFLPDVYVVARVLYVARDGGVVVSRAASAAKMSYDRFMQYVDYMAARGLVELRDGKLYITQRGVELLSQIEEVVKRLTDREVKDAVRKRGL